jgi:hypothetical protein
MGAIPVVQSDMLDRVCRLARPGRPTWARAQGPALNAAATLAYVPNERFG